MDNSSKANHLLIDHVKLLDVDDVVKFLIRLEPNSL
jgi:hypothetical protein